MADSSNWIGSGSDTIELKMSGDTAVGEAPQFTLNVDGQQIGGRQTVYADHGSGQSETFTFQGNFAPGEHDLTVTFTNNFMMPGESGDRNVYVEQVKYNGQTVSNGTTPIYESPQFQPNVGNSTSGQAVFHANDTTTAASYSNTGSNPGAVSIGSGSDKLVLQMAEDAYQGDAQFTVAVDGKQIGGTQTVTAHVAEGQRQEFDVYGDWGGGTHNVSVTFTNDKIGDFYAGTNMAVDTTDRNLYVMSASLNGGPAAGGLPWEIDSFGTKSFSVTAGSGSSDTAPITSDSLAYSGSDSGSDSGMNFVSPSDSGTTSDSNAWSGGSDSSSAWSDSQTTQDWQKPSWQQWSGNGSDTGSSGGSNWWMATGDTGQSNQAWQYWHNH
ncbi:MAG: hypothetical protein JSS43_09430 [Proteobacteria bacterium]|nr:hypothetical protein [Pseudomonadota bacterium]